MKNLITLIIRYHAFLLFLLLEFICIGFIFSHNNFQRASMINSSNAVSGDLFSLLNNIDGYFDLKSINDSLANENATLLSIIKNYENQDSLRFHESTDSNLQDYRILNAKVLSISTNLFNNHMLLNKGMVHGVSKSMGVFTDKGVVGIIKDANHNYSSVVSILSTHLQIGAVIASNNHLGYVKWDGKDPHEVELHNVFNYAPIKIGDSIITSGHSAIFPKGIMIGTIIEFEDDPSAGMYRIRVKLSANLKEINYVYVVNNKRKEELISLQNRKE